MSKIGYLGPNGSYSSLAAKQLGGECEQIAYINFPLLMNALLEGEVDRIVMPIENTLNGGVMQNIDLLQATQGVAAFAQCFVKIDHRLVTRSGASLSAIKRIYSHGQALGQCARYLAKNFPMAQHIETPSTSGCFAKLLTDEDAGIVGSHCVKEGFDYSQECISDEKLNFTQFLLVKRGEITPSTSGQRVYFSVTCKHEPGALLKLLSVLNVHHINMTKIESRPIKERVGEYRFFIEIEADNSLPAVQQALADIQKNTNSFKLLGCY